MCTYGGKATRRDFRNHLCDCMNFLSLSHAKVNPDVWMRPAIKSDGSEHCECVLLQTDDALVISENPESALRNEPGK